MPLSGILLLSLCPGSFWLGRHLGATERGHRLRLGLSLLAVLLAVAQMTGPWRVHPNDLAALLALLLPWWLLPVWGRRPHPATIAALIVCAAALWSTGSRGGLLAAAAGTLAGLWLGGRLRRRLVLAVTLLTLSALAFATTPGNVRWSGLPAAVRGWLLDHDAEGATWRHLASGRPTIWRQALHVVSDLPLFGAGAGAYGALVPDAYPPPRRRIDLPATPPRVDDAHQLYLETATAFGLPALLAFLALCVVALRRLAARAAQERFEPSSDGFSGTAAVFGGLVAYLLHGLGDCAAPGSVVYLAGWAALGLACHPPPPSITSTDRAGGRRLLGTATAIGVGTLVLLTIRGLPAELDHRRAIRAVLSGDVETQIDVRHQLQGAVRCRDAWWRERLAVAASLPGTADAVAAARCDARLLPEVMTLAPRDAERASAVGTRLPHHPDALLWKLWAINDAEAVAEPEQLAHGYFHYLALRPHDADARMELSNRIGGPWLNRHPGLHLAMLASACADGDPGANACYRAGGLALGLGLGDAVADSFFLASEWPGARRLASTARRAVDSND